MNPDLEVRPEFDRDALSDRLSTTLNERDRGLLTQIEYEEKLVGIVLSYNRHLVLEETELRGGGTRFVLRRALTRDTVECLEYRRWGRLDRRC